MQNTSNGILDGNAGDLQAPALVAAAGSTGLAADAGHVHPNTGLWFGPSVTVKSGGYILGETGIATSATLGNGSLRVSPLLLTRQITISAIGADFTVAGDAASVFRMAIYGDDGTCYPGALLLDGGSISTGTGNAGTVATGGTPGTYMNTGITALTLVPGIYWTGGTVQGVTVTQPTMRIATWGQGLVTATNAQPSSGGQAFGFSVTGVTGSLPGSFTVFASSGSASSLPRIILKMQ